MAPQIPIANAESTSNCKVADDKRHHQRATTAPAMQATSAAIKKSGKTIPPSCAALWTMPKNVGCTTSDKPSAPVVTADLADITRQRSGRSKIWMALARCSGGKYELNCAKRIEPCNEVSRYHTRQQPDQKPMPDNPGNDQERDEHRCCADKLSEKEMAYNLISEIGPKFAVAAAIRTKTASAATVLAMSRRLAMPDKAK